MRFDEEVRRTRARMVRDEAQRTGEDIVTCGVNGCTVELTESGIRYHRWNWHGVRTCGICHQARPCEDGRI